MHYNCCTVYLSVVKVIASLCILHCILSTIHWWIKMNIKKCWQHLAKNGDQYVWHLAREYQSKKPLQGRRGKYWTSISVRHLLEIVANPLNYRLKSYGKLIFFYACRQQSKLMIRAKMQFSLPSVLFRGKEGRTFKVYLLVVAPCISNFTFSR